MEWKKGDILKGRYKAGAIHPIVFLEGHDDSYFIGAMVSSKGPESYKDSIPMKRIHMCDSDEAGHPYKTRFGPTFLVDAKLLKRLEWRPFRKTGKLTSEGIDFVEKQIRDKNPLLWEEYESMRSKT